MLVHDILDRAVRLNGTRPALVDGDTRLTYNELHTRVGKLAASLQALGLDHGDHVAILAHNSFRYMEAYLAASVAGVVLAPINTRLSPSETAFILKDGEVKALLLDKGFLPLWREIQAGLNLAERVIVLDGAPDESLLDYEALLADADPAAVRPRSWQEDDMLCLCYTGGTTGLPKGVMLSQRNVVSNVLHALQFAEFNERDIWLHASPMFHLADSWACFALTALGAFHVFMPRFEPKQALDLIQQYRITVTLIVPTMINMLLDYPQLGDYDLSSLRRLVYGAAPMPVERLKTAVKVFGPILQQAYGQTETSPFLTVTSLRDLDPHGDEQAVRRLASCGQEVLGVEVRVVDLHDQPVRPGEVGEIVARGPNVMLGYWKRPKETAAALVESRIRTGDLATVDEDNYVYLVDRAKDMIITGAENVYSTEVENALYRHPAIREAAVIGVPDDVWGEVVKAVVVLREGETVSAEALIDHCRQLIAAFKCPRTVDFVSELPKSGAGKILKSELRKPYWAERKRAVN